MSSTVRGRSYRLETRAPKQRQEGVKPRVIVEGVTHPKGQPIRFKSIDRAERHMRNMRLGQ